MDEFTHLRIRLESLKSTLSEYPPKDRAQPISQVMASHFNEIRAATIKLDPDLEKILPSEIALTNRMNEFSTLNRPIASYFDLQTFTNELIGILTHLESGN